jgi:ATP-grasp domain
VQTVCPSGHPIVNAGVGGRMFKYRALAPLQSVAAAIASANPDFIVSGDDLATLHLHRLYADNQHSGTNCAAVCELIERSLGAPEYFRVVDDRSSFIKISGEAGARVPLDSTITNAEDLRNWIASSGFPTVLKASGSSGGTGVRVVRNAEQAQRALRELQAPPLFARAAKRALFDADATLVWPSLLRRGSVVNAQAFVGGHEATSATFCWKGTVLASLHFAVLQKSHSFGHATVVRRIEHPEMVEAIEKVARRLGLSGFHGFDFMLAERTNDAYLIEINPRATQVGHLAFGPGRDLPAAIVSALTCTPAKLSPSVTMNDTIALFPQEWLREPSSPYLHSGYHDVPWGQPELVRACVRKSRAPFSRMLSRMTSH